MREKLIFSFFYISVVVLFRSCFRTLAALLEMLQTPLAALVSVGKPRARCSLPCLFLNTTYQRYPCAGYSDPVNSNAAV